MKIEFNNHFKAVPFLVTLVMGFILMLWFVKFDIIAIQIFSAATIIFSLPAAYLHFEYLLANRGQTIEVTSEGVKVETKDGKSIKYSNIEIEKVVVYKSARIENGGIPLLPMEFYYYARVILTGNKENLIITCLMSNDLSNELNRFRDIKFEIKRSVFASIKHPVVLSIFGSTA